MWGRINDIEVAFVELDVSTNPPQVIRQGYIVGGVFTPDDINFESFWECLGQGAASSLVACVLTNCGYFQCVGIGVAANGIICGISSIFN